MNSTKYVNGCCCKCSGLRRLPNQRPAVVVRTARRRRAPTSCTRHTRHQRSRGPMLPRRSYRTPRARPSTQIAFVNPICLGYSRDAQPGKELRRGRPLLNLIVNRARPSIDLDVLMLRGRCRRTSSAARRHAVIRDRDLSSIMSMLSVACSDFADGMPLGLPCRVKLAGSTGRFWRLICINDPPQWARQKPFG
jgi:hypothetical protein